MLGGFAVHVERRRIGAREVAIYSTLESQAARQSTVRRPTVRMLGLHEALVFVSKTVRGI